MAEMESSLEFCERMEALGYDYHWAIYMYFAYALRGQEGEDAS